MAATFLRNLFRFLARRRTLTGPSYGAPVRAIIAPAACGGFLLFINYEHRQIAADADLGLRMEEYEVPNASEFAAADRGLADLGLIRNQPWNAEGYPGKFVASITNA
jgi:hypothetical protein